MPSSTTVARTAIDHSRISLSADEPLYQPGRVPPCATSAARAAADEEDAAKSPDQRVGEALTLIRTRDGWAFITMLTHLSMQSPDHRVQWRALCDAMTMSTPKLSGLVGAMERSLRPNHPHYERRTVTEKSQSRMSPDVANVVIDTISKKTDESLNTDVSS